MINAAGHFKETQWRAILEAVINITVSILLIKPLGMYGLLIGTICSFAYRTTDIIYYAHKHILDISCKKSVLRVLRVALVISLNVILYKLLVGKYVMNSWGEWIMYENRILQYFGRISLIVLCIHGPVYRVVVKIISIPLHMGTDAVREKFLLAMLVMIVTMVICSLAYEIIVRVAPWMIGKKKVKAL